MAKNAMTTKEREVWHSLQTLSNWQQQNIVRDLDQLWGLRPRILKLGTGNRYVPYTFELFDKEVEVSDNYCTAYYSPKDASKIIGSREKNYRDWVRALTGCGSDPHFHYQDIPWVDVQLKGGNIKGYRPDDWTSRFLSVHALVFYLAVQSRTWGKTPAQHARISQIKMMLEKHGIQGVVHPPAYSSDIDFDAIAPPRPKREPKTVVVVSTVSLDRLAGADTTATTPEPEVPTIVESPPPEQPKTLLDELNSLDEQEYHELLVEAGKARKHRTERRELRLAVRDAVSGDYGLLSHLILTYGLQKWMLRTTAADALGIPEHQVTHDDMFRTKKAMMLLSGILEGDEIHSAAFDLAGSVIRNKRVPGRALELLSAIN